MRTSIPFKESKGADRELVEQILLYTLTLRDIDQERTALEFSNTLKRTLEDEEIQLCYDALLQYGFGSPKLFDHLSTATTRSNFFASFPHTVRLLSQLYFRSGRLMLQTEALANQSLVAKLERMINKP